MLETLVSSRIRRTLLEHILSCPSDRFYLRGLAKTLQLSVSPLRRELKRLEDAGVLSAVAEGTMRFYTVKTASPMFRQLQQVGGTVSVPCQPTVARGAEPIRSFDLAQDRGERVKRAEPRLRSGLSPESCRRTEAARRSLHTPLVVSERSESKPRHGPILAGAVLLVLLVGVVSATLSQQRYLPQVLRFFTPPHGSLALERGEAGASLKGGSETPPVLAHGAGFTQTRAPEVTPGVTAVLSVTSSRVMRSTHWQVAPTGTGGFGVNAPNEKY